MFALCAWSSSAASLGPWWGSVRVGRAIYGRWAAGAALRVPFVGRAGKDAAGGRCAARAPTTTMRKAEKRLFGYSDAHLLRAVMRCVAADR